MLIFISRVFCMSIVSKESALIRQGLEYFQSLLAMLEASNPKFQVFTLIMIFMKMSNYI